MRAGSCNLLPSADLPLCWRPDHTKRTGRALLFWQLRPTHLRLVMDGCKRVTDGHDSHHYQCAFCYRHYVYPHGNGCEWMHRHDAGDDSALLAMTVQFCGPKNVQPSRSNREGCFLVPNPLSFGVGQKKIETRLQMGFSLR